MGLEDQVRVSGPPCPNKYPLGVALAQNSRGLDWLPTRGSGQEGAPSWLEFCWWQAVGPGLPPGGVKAGSEGW